MHLSLVKNILMAAIFTTPGVNTAFAQITGTVPSPFESIGQNSVSNMAAFGDTLWIGPGLNRNIGNSEGWFLPQEADSIVTGRGRVFSLSLEADTVIAGLGFDFETADGSVQTGLGYHVSLDGGDTWSFIPLPLEGENETEFIYGGEIYSILPITVPQQSPPFKLDFEQNAIFSANWASGIMRSRDFGQTWERLILPPFSADSLVPEQTYTFDADGTNRYDPRFDQNFLGFSVLIDRNRNIWAGTAGGVNLSANAFSTPRDSIRWKHLKVNGSNNGLLGNWIIAIREQPPTGDIWMTNWVAGLNADEKYGIVRTSDYGQSFDQYLIGERINDLGFSESYIFAAGDNGLFISSDNGQNWRQIKHLQSPNTFIKSSARYFSVAVTTNRVWIGTSDGLASTDDLGQTWEITRVNFPLEGKNQFQENAPNVEAYAYPNPFSPGRHELVRIKFNVEQQGNVKIRLFDFGMNLIRELENNSFPAGTYEAIWNGRDRNGKQVANGPVFYQINSPGSVARGKILVLD